MIQQLLDFVRVIGNNTVHPGMIDLKDNSVLAIKLFDLVNIVAEIMITQPKEIKALYEGVLPESAREGINNRDKSNT
jgi:hypothetical protein